MKQKILIAICAVLLLTSCQSGTTIESDGTAFEVSSNVLEIPVEESAPSVSIESPTEYGQYCGEPYVEVNGNEPFFTKDERSRTDIIEEYSELDALGRCGPAFATVCKQLMPTEEREGIGQVKPSGWHTVKYDTIDGKYLYNRCHLIGYQLAGENANERNLITGTRYLNTTGMLPFENMVADFVKEHDAVVLYRVTPVYRGDNLVADGVLMEAYGEAKGDTLSFCVFVFNVQPGIGIDYETGESWLLSDESPDSLSGHLVYDLSEADYVLNKNSGKFHTVECRYGADMKEENRELFTGDRGLLIKAGYEPCGSCNP